MFCWHYNVTLFHLDTGVKLNSVCVKPTSCLDLSGGVFPGDGGGRSPNPETQQAHPVPEDGALPSEEGHHFQPLPHGLHFQHQLRRPELSEPEWPQVGLKLASLETRSFWAVLSPDCRLLLQCVWISQPDHGPAVRRGRQLSETRRRRVQRHQSSLQHGWKWSSPPRSCEFHSAPWFRCSTHSLKLFKRFDSCWNQSCRNLLLDETMADCKTEGFEKTVWLILF